MVIHLRSILKAKRNSTIHEKDAIFVLVSTITHSLPRALVSALNVSILPLCVNRLCRK